MVATQGVVSRRVAVVSLDESEHDERLPLIPSLASPLSPDPHLPPRTTTPAGRLRCLPIPHSPMLTTAADVELDRSLQLTFAENLLSPCVHRTSTSYSASGSVMVVSAPSCVSDVSPSPSHSCSLLQQLTSVGPKSAATPRNLHRLCVSQTLDLDGPANVAVRRVRNWCQLDSSTNS